MFVMCSGALVLKPNAAQRPLHYWLKWWQHRLPKLLVPLMIWSVVWLGVQQWQASTPLDIPTALRITLFDQPFEHLYFLWILAFLSLSTPAVEWLIHRLDHQLPLLLIVLGGLAVFAPSTRFVGLFWLPYLFYYLSGWYFAHRQQLSASQAWQLVLFTTTAIWWGTAYLTLHVQATKNFWLMDYFSPLVMLQSIGVFGLARHFAARHKVFSLAQLSGGVYLLHPLVYLGFVHLTPTLVPHHGWHLLPFTAVLVTVTATLTWLIQKIGGKWLVF